VPATPDEKRRKKKQTPKIPAKQQTSAISFPKGSTDMPGYRSKGMISVFMVTSDTGKEEGESKKEKKREKKGQT
jgi:hypothetical protein